MTVMQTPNFPEYPTEDEISLLDILQVVVDNLRLLVIGPMLAGLLALAVAWVWPKTYESTAILKADQTTASVMLSAAVLDPIARNMGYATTMSTDEARMKLARQVKASINAKDKLLTLTTQADTPQAAQALAQAVLQQTFTQSQPRDSEKLRLEKQLAQAKAREAEAMQAMQLLVKKLDAASGNGAPDLAQGYAQMMGVVKESQAAQFDIERQLQSLDTSALVQQPILPTKPVAPKMWLVAVLVTLASGFLLLIFVFSRQTIHNVSKNSDLAKKFESLQASWRKALGKIS
jgi:uncharacterized protein involved in exopolysaccharide biosynthesis